MRAVLALGALCAAAVACLPAGDFACDGSEQCSRLAGGVCQADGRCSYPDEGCESGQRYSEFAGGVAGACVPVPEDSSAGSGSTGGMEASGGPGSSGSTDGPGTTGPLPESCDGVDCGGAGTCVEVDGTPTCACDPGLYDVGLSCVEDPCDAVTCRFVDADLGDDAADGSRDAPWQTLARLEEALAQASPGDHFMLRRGRQWSASLELNGVQGSFGAPIVVGAYGPVGEPAPQLRPGSLGVRNSEQVVVRDLWIEDDITVTDPPNRPCVTVTDGSREVILLGNTIAGCINRGIRLGDGASYTVIVDNVITGVEDKGAIFLADANWTMPPEFVGPHHWVIDNVITGTLEDGITVNVADATTDVKVVGNRVADTLRTGVNVIGGGWAWSVGNVVARTGDDAAGTGGGINFDAIGPVTGNVVFESRYGFDLDSTGVFEHNTVVHERSRPAIEVDNTSSGRVLTNNLVLVRNGAFWASLPGSDLADDIALMDLNWYATDGDPCLFEVMGMSVELAEFSMLTGFDMGSSCGAVPGFGNPPAGVPIEGWDEAFWGDFTPDMGWERCGDPAGARGCEGEVLGGELQPIEGYLENDGFGWAGPLVVRQRYPVG